MSAPGLDILLVGEDDYTRPIPSLAGLSAFSLLRDAAARLTGFADVLPPRMGVVLLATHAARAGLRAAVLSDVLSSPVNRIRFRRLLSAHPRAVGISTVSIQSPETVKEIVAVIKSHSPGSVVILGGHGAALLPAARAHADITVLGYGENTLVRVLQALKSGVPPAAVPGAVTDAEKNRIIQGEYYYESGIKPLFPDWGFVGNSRRVLSVEGSRGCRFNCSFCTTPNRKRQVFRAPAEVLDEVVNDVEKHGAKLINFVDSSFTSDPAFIDSFLDLYAGSGLSVPWACLSRVDDFSRHPGLTGRMAKTGCVKSTLGIESIHDDILSRMRKGYDRRAVEAGLSRLDGLRVHANFIIGFPGDTPDKVKETVDFIEKFPVEGVTITPLYVPEILFEQARQDPVKFCHLSGSTSTDWRHDTMNHAQAEELSEWARRRLRSGGKVTVS